MDRLHAGSVVLPWLAEVALLDLRAERDGAAGRGAKALGSLGVRLGINAALRDPS